MQSWYLKEYIHFGETIVGFSRHFSVYIGISYDWTEIRSSSNSSQFVTSAGPPSHHYRSYNNLYLVTGWTNYDNYEYLQLYVRKKRSASKALTCILYVMTVWYASNQYLM